MEFRFGQARDKFDISKALIAASISQELSSIV